MTPFTYTPRTYLHLDYPIGATHAEQLATTPAAVARHAFLPFIRYTVWSQKIRKNKGGGVKTLPPKPRPIEYAAHHDAQILAYYSAILTEQYESALASRGLRRAVTAFRPIDRMCNVHFADEVFEFIRRQAGCAVLATDIKNYFGSIRHTPLKAAWSSLLGMDRLPLDHFKVFKAVTSSAWVERERLCQALQLDPENPRADGRGRYCSAEEFRRLIRGHGLIEVNSTRAGIPQGSPISAILSNLYLLEFDTAMAAFAEGAGGLYRRYCDDIILVVPAAAQRDAALRLMRSLLETLGLVAHPEKTELLDFKRSGNRLTTERALNYLGFTFDGENKRIRPASIARYYKKMRSGVGRIKALRYRASKKAGKWLPLRLRRIYLAYSYIGSRNFISYALRAAKIMKDDGIKKQVKRHWKKLQALIKGTNS